MDEKNKEVFSSITFQIQEHFKRQSTFQEYHALERKYENKGGQISCQQRPYYLHKKSLRLKTRINFGKCRLLTI